MLLDLVVNKTNLVSFFFEKKSVGIVISDTLFFNENRVIKQLYKKKPPPTGKVFSELLTQYYISLETVIIRKSALESLSEWFDSRFDVIEEFDLFVRISYQWELEYVNKVLSKWRVHNKSLTWQKPELFPFETNLFINKIISYSFLYHLQKLVSLKFHLF